MPPADPPAVIASLPAKPADVVVISRDTHSEILASKDTPLALIKGRKTEDALLRQAITLTSTLTVARPAPGTGDDVLRWTYEPYLQRQLCFTSMTGQFSCAAAEVEELAEKAEGQAPVAAATGEAAPNPSPAAEAAHHAVAAALRARADAVFDDDRRLKLDPMLKAGGVSVRRTPVSSGAARRAPAGA